MIDNQQNNSGPANGKKEMVIRKWTKAISEFNEMRGKEQNLHTLREKLTNTAKECMEIFDFGKCHQGIPTPIESVFIGLVNSLVIVDNLLLAGCDYNKSNSDAEREIVIKEVLGTKTQAHCNYLLDRAANLADMLALTHKQIQEAR